VQGCGLPAVTGPRLAVGADPVPSGRADDWAAAPRISYTRAWVALGAGVALTAASFVLAEHADDDYARYLAGADPDALGDAYASAVHADRWASATLLAGQLALALGLYWRFVYRPAAGSAARAAAAPSAAAAGPRLSLRAAPGGRGASLVAALAF
jgi:hypothetical protein